MTVAFRLEGRGLTVEVADDGTGFDVSARDLPESQGRGLENMRARAAALGGRSTSRPRPAPERASRSGPSAAVRCRSGEGMNMLFPARDPAAPSGGRERRARSRRDRVAVVEDDPGLRESLRLLIGGTRGFAWAGGYRSAEEALQRLGPAGGAPDVLLMDIHPPACPARRRADVREAHPAVAVLMLSVYEGEDPIFTSLCNGAAGYLLKKTAPAKLLEAIRDVKGGGSPTPGTPRKVISAFRDAVPWCCPDDDLTPQEVRLLKLLSDGASYQAAGDKLGISINIDPELRAVHLREAPRDVQIRRGEQGAEGPNHLKAMDLGRAQGPLLSRLPDRCI